jgi:hypothetical protein
MVFKLALTYKDPSQGANVQRGFPAPGSGAQLSGPPSQARQPDIVPRPNRPTKGIRSWFMPSSPSGEQRGMAPAGTAAQMRPNGSMPNVPPIYGQNIPVYTPYYSRGAAAFVQNYGKVLTNPIGAGIVANNRPQASYGPSSEYHNGMIFWTSQAVPTSVGMNGLTSPQVLAALLGRMNVQAAVRVA